MNFFSMKVARHMVVSGMVVSHNENCETSIVVALLDLSCIGSPLQSSGESMRAVGRRCMFYIADLLLNSAGTFWQVACRHIVKREDPLILPVHLTTKLGCQRDMSATKDVPRKPRHFKLFSDRLQTTRRDVFRI